MRTEHVQINPPARFPQPRLGPRLSQSPVSDKAVLAWQDQEVFPPTDCYSVVKEHNSQWQRERERITISMLTMRQNRCIMQMLTVCQNKIYLEDSRQRVSFQEEFSGV